MPNAGHLENPTLKTSIIKRMKPAMSLPNTTHIPVGLAPVKAEVVEGWSRSDAIEIFGMRDTQ